MAKQLTNQIAELQHTKLCITAAIQIKGTTWWLYCVKLEYQPSQQIVQLDHAESAT